MFKKLLSVEGRGFLERGNRWSAWRPAARLAAPARSLTIIAGAAAVLSFGAAPVDHAAQRLDPPAASLDRGAAKAMHRGSAAAADVWRPFRTAQAEWVGFEQVAERSRSGWPEVERLLESVGVDLDRLLARFGAVPPAQGGPFVALDGLKPKPKGGPTDDMIAGLHAENLQKALRSLPLSAPLDQFQLESGFGARTDPFNHRRSVHTGLDFSAPFRSPVYSTGPGVVIYAGPKGDYGKVVEIDHGGGIATRYAHLHRTMVVRGQRVGEHEQIGQLGSTGRSSGPHVHYEVLVNGVPQDPEKFLAIGRSVRSVAAR